MKEALMVCWAKGWDGYGLGEPCEHVEGSIEELVWAQGFKAARLVKRAEDVNATAKRWARSYMGHSTGMKKP